MRHALITLAACVALAGPAVAQDADEPVEERWLYADMLDGATGWDLNSAVYEDDADTHDIVRFIYFDTLKTDQPFAFQWVFQEVRLDCDDNTFQLLRGDFYDGDRKLVANMVPDETLHPVRETTTEWLLKMSLCDGVLIEDQRESTVLDEMMTEVEGFAAQ